MSCGFPNNLYNYVVNYQLPSTKNEKIAFCTIVAAGIFTGAAVVTLLTTSDLNIKLAAVCVIAINTLIVAIARRSMPNQQKVTITENNQENTPKLVETQKNNALLVEEFEAAMNESSYQFEKMRALADQGCAPAQYEFAEMNERNYNFLEALNYYKKAAEQNYGKAQYAVAFLYYHGTQKLYQDDAISVDITQAIKYSKLGAQNNNYSTKDMFIQICKKGYGTPEDQALAQKYNVESIDDSTSESDGI